MDAFFASVEERDRPWLSGKPVVIGADPEGGLGRGVVSTANYIARTYGITSATPIQVAWRRSEQARKEGKAPAFFLTPDSQKYKQVSQYIFAILAQFGPVERASIDEAYIDLSACRSYKKARVIAERIKAHIKRQHKVTASIGIGPNKLVAKIASDADKPNGLTVITPSRVSQFFSPLPVEALPGVGPQTLRVLRKKNVYTVADLQKHTYDSLTNLFGAFGKDLYHKAHGVGDTNIVDTPAKPQSIGEQETYTTDTVDSFTIFASVEAISERIVTQAQKKDVFAFRQVIVTVRFADFQTISRSHTFPTHRCQSGDIYRYALQLVMPFIDGRANSEKKSIRLIGIRIEQLI